MPTLTSIEANLRKIALAYPGAFEDFPWGERVIKVAKKIFVFMGVQEKKLSITTKLPRSREMALLMPLATPTGYNLGKHGWVTARFKRVADVPVGLLIDWIDESYRAVAATRLVKELESSTARRPRGESSS